MNLPARYWSPDENAPTAEDLTEADRAWILDRTDPTWKQRTYSVEAAWQELYPANADKMEALIAEVDDDNRQAEWLDCGETLADVIAGIGMTPALMKRQAGDRR